MRACLALAATLAVGCDGRSAAAPRPGGASPELPAPAPPPKRPAGSIAYTRGAELRTIEPDGSGDRLVWKAPAVPGRADLTFHVTGATWRPDGGELAFASDHQAAMSPYATDLWAVAPDGTNLRKLTNAPAHAALAGYPKGKVVVTLQPTTPGPFFVYVQGAAEPKVATGGGRLVFDGVADLGDAVQAVTATNGADHWVGTPVDVAAGKSVDAGLLLVGALNGVPGHGASEPFWRGDGAEVGFLGPLCLPQKVPARPRPGFAHQPLIAAEAAKNLCVAAWGPKLAFATVGFDAEGRTHVYLVDAGAKALPAPLVSFDRYRRITDVVWRPDGRSLVVVVQDDLVDEDMNLHEIDVAGGKTRKLTDFAFGEEKLRRVALSPDGKTVVFERTKDLVRGGADLWIADGAGARLLVAGGGYPAWNPRR